MPYTVICISCNLLFRYGQVFYQTRKRGWRRDIIYHLVCTHCGTEHLIHYHDWFRPDVSYVLLAKERPRFRAMTAEEIAGFEHQEERAKRAWRRFSAKRTPPSPRSQLRADIYEKIGSCSYVALIVLTMPIRLLFFYLRMMMLWFVGSQIGSWEIPEFGEKWDVVDRGNGNPLYNTFRCSYCGEVGGLTNGGVWACPHCGQDSLCTLEDYDLILKNGRKVFVRFYAGFS